MSFEPPVAIRAAYKDWRWSVASEWADIATTWRLENGDGATHYLKLGRLSRSPNARDECDRMRWARQRLPVPEVLDCGTDGTVDWFLTMGLDGCDATAHHLREQPPQLVAALARGLAAFHAAAPVDTCPFEFTNTTAIAHVHRRAEQGLIDPDKDLHAQHQHLTVDTAIEQLELLAPADADLVVCHGDYCLPNILLDEAGHVTGYVDLGELGIADPWWDIAVGSWSVTWNLGPGWEDLFISTYGTTPDPRRIAFYRLLYDLAS